MSTSPIPPVLDQDRYAVYQPTAATTDFALGFPLFGEAADVAVYLDGDLLKLTNDYTIRSTANGATLTPAPVTDAYVRLNTPISAGKLEIFGNFRPRRTIQATAPYGTRDFNFAFSLLMAAIREMWTKFTRAIKVPVGEAELTIPGSMERAGQVLAFDSTGQPTVGGRYSDLMASASLAAISAASARESAQTAAASAAAAATFEPSYFLRKDDNLASLGDNAEARTNLGLAAVATSGAYSDLSGKPTVGAGAGSLVAYDANGKYPAGDGSQLTNLNVFGVNQAYKSALGSRSIGTVYQNTTSKPILVCVSFTTANGSTGYNSLLVGASNPPDVVVGYIGSSDTGTASHYACFVVAPGHYYQVSGGRALSYWSEMGT